MAHDHHHGPDNFGWAFAVGIGLNTAFVLVEAGFGFYADSLALLADAGHNLIDVLGLLLAWGGGMLARTLPTRRRTYGLRRSSILAALLNAMLLLIAVGAIGSEAVRRFSQPEPPPASIIIAVAAVGIVINTATALLFLRGGSKDVNIRGAFLHMAADAAVSLGVVIAGFAMQWTHWTWIDPAISLAIAAVILWSTWDLFRESLDLALDAVPRGIDPQAVNAYLSDLPGVVGVHDLHIWALSTTEPALTAHLIIPAEDDTDTLLSRASKELHERFGIEHTTLQVERGNADLDACNSVCGMP
jgi:cobalt-zinc-cadmium efflux system protein